MQTEPGVDGSDSSTFAQTLESLKREGCNILIVGASATAAHEAVCQRLLGDLSAHDRYRLTVTGEGVTYRSQTCHHGHAGSNTRVVAYPDGPTTAETDTPQNPLGTFGADFIDAIREIEADANGLEPAELRVCVDSLVPLLTEYETETVFKLLHLTSVSVKNAHGMGHYHLPVARDHDAVNLLEPLFEAIVEVRTRGERTEQRWHLRDQSTASDWLEL